MDDKELDDIECISVGCSNYCLNNTCSINRIDCFYRDIPAVTFIEERSRSIYEPKQEDTVNKEG